MLKLTDAYGVDAKAIRDDLKKEPKQSSPKRQPKRKTNPRGCSLTIYKY
jgi:hypothetical protein